MHKGRCGLKIGLRTGRWKTRLGAGLVAGLLALAGTPAVYAQDALPATLISAPGAIDTAGRAQIKDFIAKHKDGLTSAEIPVFQRARAAILDPLNKDSVSVSFRSAYTDELLPVLQPLTGDSRDLVAVNSLRIAGELATTKATGLLEAATKSPKVVVRYEAVAGIGRTFDAISRTAPAIDVNTARGLVKTLGPMLRAETDPQVFDAIVRALMSAGAIDKPEWGSIREDAMLQLAPAVSERFQKLGNKAAEEGLMKALIRAAAAGRDALVNQGVGGGKALGPDAAKAIGAMGGDAIAYVYRLIQAQAFPTIQGNDPQPVQEQKAAARTYPADLVSVGFAAITLANDTLLGQPLPNSTFGQQIQTARNEDDAKFLVAARDLLGPNGAMTKPPFGLAANRFIQ